ncbi:MAG: hypothetical protein EAZ57_05695 [Cytophagales bacterium]|nr:MAG: hypothetical protein EAZ67_06600 [Cytophagales bacterium]TAF60847.1 MAG: hypothetical protein EAZ57_05695 [Cytophagales bacterium]
MQKLYENPYITISWSENDGLVEACWTPQTETMTDEMFKVSISEIWKAVKTYKPHGFLGDTQFFHYLINPEVQEWYGHNIKGTFGTHTRYLAMIMSSTFISQLSIEQTIEEDTSANTITHYFDNLEEARLWLNSRPKI